MSTVESNNIHKDPIILPWQAACSANSSARKTLNDQVITLPRAHHDRLSYISTDHQNGMDLCEHPEIQYQHGFTSWYVFYEAAESLNPFRIVSDPYQCI